MNAYKCQHECCLHFKHSLPLPRMLRIVLVCVTRAGLESTSRDQFIDFIRYRQFDITTKFKSENKSLERKTK